jgi:hypothetical protein
MLENPDNSDPKEATEAKLCAYLEGELTAAEKVEIEQHLAANPQHRQLLAELAKTRDWMRSIPRENSPVDLGELFQGQVERAMLLDDSAEMGSGMSINRWPQYLLVAAVTVLMLGLSVVLVAILKSPGNTSGLGGGNASVVNKAFSMAGSSQPTDGAVNKSPAEHSTVPLPPVDGGAPSVIAAVPPETTAAPMPPLMGSSRGRESANQADTIKTELKTAGIRLSPGQRTVCFLVSADTPAATAEQVRGFFDRHQIAVDNLSEPSRYSAVGGGTGAGGVNLGNGAGHQQLAGADNNSDSGATRNAAAPNTQTTPNVVVQGGGQNFTHNQVVQAPGAGDETNQIDNNVLGDKAQHDRPLGTVAPAAKSQLASLDSSVAGNTVYVARGVTPLQMELLNASLLGRADLKQTVQRVSLASPEVDRLTPLPAGAIAKGEKLTVTIPQLVGPGIEKTNVVTVSDDGTITLPMIDPVTAAGLTPAELQKRVADKYREGNLIPDAEVSIAATGPLAAAPATQSIKDRVLSTTNPVIATGPTTRAADPTLLDVVVVIQPSRFTAGPPVTMPVK